MKIKQSKSKCKFPLKYCTDYNSFKTKYLETRIPHTMMLTLSARKLRSEKEAIDMIMYVALVPSL